MRRLLFKASLVIFAIAAYVAAPFHTAWSVREAVRNGDSAYLTTAVDWPSVRVTLTPSLNRIALGLPEADGDTAKASMWQRFKAYWGRGAVASAVESYLTPEGLPQLYSMRKTFRTYVTGTPDDDSRPLFERIRNAIRRVKRIEFLDMTTFEVDMIDKNDNTRLIHARLNLQPTGWKLTSLKLSDVNPDGDVPAIDAQEAQPQPLLTVPSNAIEARDVGGDADETDVAAVPAPRKRTSWGSFFIRAAEAAQPRPAPRNSQER